MKMMRKVMIGVQAVACLRSTQHHNPDVAQQQVEKKDLDNETTRKQYGKISNLQKHRECKDVKSFGVAIGVRCEDVSDIFTKQRSRADMQGLLSLDRPTLKHVFAFLRDPRWWLRGKPDYSFRIMAVGDRGVGKYNLLRRFMGDELHFTGSRRQMYSKSCTIPVDGKSVKLNVDHLPSSDRWHSVHRTQYKISDGFLMCYAVDDPETLDNLKYFKLEIDRYQEYQKVGMVFVGCKADSSTKHDHTIPIETAREKAKEFGIECQCFEVDVVKGIDVSEAFEALAKNSISKKEMPVEEKSEPEKNQKKEKRCCIM